MPELAEIFSRCGPEYITLFGNRMPSSHTRALRDIIDCRTAALGGQLVQCTTCGYQQYSYHSCKNRSCPKCHRSDTDVWIKNQEKLLVDVIAFHLVFTIPRELHDAIRSHQRKLYGILMKAAAVSILKLAGDPRYLGGSVGILAVLHTWTRAMVYHPHVHCLVPGAGLSDDHHRIKSRHNFLVPVRALSVLFRARFMAMARKALPGITLPEVAWGKPWVVYSKPASHGADTVLKYLARYVHRVAITNNRIINDEQEKITFRYFDSRDHRHKTMTLNAMEFTRRFLQHVLPRGLHKVRYYGLYSPANRHLLKYLRTQPAQESKTRKNTDNKNNDHEGDNFATALMCQCPNCHEGSMRFIAWLPRAWRGPP